jgi:hypothetical protein
MAKVAINRKENRSLSLFIVHEIFNSNNNRKYPPKLRYIRPESGLRGGKIEYKDAAIEHIAFVCNPLYDVQILLRFSSRVKAYISTGIMPDFP